MNPTAFDRSAFVEIFRQEAAENLERANQGLLVLENEPNNRTLLNEVTRFIHTVKGGARMVALDELNRLAHKMEDVLSAARDQNLSLTSPLIDLLFTTLDGLRQLVEAPSPETAASIGLEELCTNLEHASRGEDFQVPRPSQIDTTAEVEQATPQPEPKPAVSVAPAPEGPRGTPPPAMTSRPAEEGTLRLAIRKLDVLANNVNEMLIMHGRSVAEVRQLREILSSFQHQQKLWAQLRVDLLSQFGQGASPPAELLALVDQLEHVEGNLWERAERLWKSASYRVDRTQIIVDELRQDVMELQMVPVSTIFDTFQRSVRDLAREHGKQVRLVVEGGETELDRRIIERLRDPLIHMVRNAIDHGIESPEERERQTKSPEATLTLSACQEGMRVSIELSDDGRGIDIERVKAAAAQKGVRTEEELAVMSDNEAVRLIFEEGFSTRERVTETSGRGVGMDVVKSVIEELDGDAGVETTPGQGTKVTLTLPLTLALARTLLVRGGDQPLAIPAASIEDLVRVHEHEIGSLGAKEAIEWRSQTIPLVRLTQLLGLDHELASVNGSFPVVVLRHGGHTVGFAVDELLTELEVVVKGLGQHLRRVPKVTGTTILGTGELVLILHPPDLIAAARAGATSIRRPTTVVERTQRAMEVLVVDDSFVTREMLRSLLESYGCEVEVAVDGMDGMQKALEKSFDLVLTDVEMPRMDGFELTARLRQREETRNLPIVIVTSLEREEHKRRGLEVGASAYIVKNAFDQRALLDTIERLIGE